MWGWNPHSQKWEVGVLRDSRKLRARLQGSNLLAFEWSYCRWKALLKGYKFGLDLAPIEGWGEKLWSPKVLRLQTGTPKKRNCIEEIISKCQWGHWPFLLVGESVVTLALGLRPKQGVARWRAKKDTREHITCPRECKKVWGSEPSHSQVNSHVGSWWELESQKDSRNFRERFEGSKLHGWLCSLYQWKALEV
jgi:hypothetical protein